MFALGGCGLRKTTGSEIAPKIGSSAGLGQAKKDAALTRK